MVWPWISFLMGLGKSLLVFSDRLRLLGVVDEETTKKERPRSLRSLSFLKIAAKDILPLLPRQGERALLICCLLEFWR